MERKEEFALQRVTLLLAWSVDSNESIPKVALLFERHLNIDLLSLFESEGTNKSLVSAKHLFANTRQALTTRGMAIFHLACSHMEYSIPRVVNKPDIQHSSVQYLLIIMH